MMALFIWLRPEEYRNYYNLYIAGKVIGLVLFMAWEILSFSGKAFNPEGWRNFPDMESMIKAMILLGGSVFLSLTDTLSVWGASDLLRKSADLLRKSGDLQRKSGDLLHKSENI